MILESCRSSGTILHLGRVRAIFVFGLLRLCCWCCIGGTLVGFMPFFVFGQVRTLVWIVPFSSLLLPFFVFGLVLLVHLCCWSGWPRFGLYRVLL
ncbi:hypothetical protein U1Q18_042092 [Sarracenia purpurea var. burkii]